MTAPSPTIAAQHVPPPAPAAQRTGARRWFFVGAGATMLLIVLLGFGPTLYLRKFFRVFPIPPYLYVHGVLMTFWYVLLPTQAALICARRTALHRSLGLAGLCLAVALLGTGAFVVLNLMARLNALGIDPATAINRFHVNGVVIGSLFSLVLFATFVGCAYFWRRQATIHARCMVLASVSMMGPPLTTNRWLGAWLESLSPWLGFPSVLAALLIAMGLFDLITRRRLHWVTVAGAVAIFGTFYIAETIAQTPAGRAFVVSLANAH